jgi:hypothetical protein
MIQILVVVALSLSAFIPAETFAARKKIASRCGPITNTATGKKVAPIALTKKMGGDLAEYDAVYTTKLSNYVIVYEKRVEKCHLLRIEKRK